MPPTLRSRRFTRSLWQYGGLAALSFVIPMAVVAAQQPPAITDLTGDWVYGGTDGRVLVTQTGNHVTLQLTYTPNGDPPPHYVIETTLSAQSLDGTWKCLARVCLGQNGKFHADVAPTRDRITVSRTDDPGNRNGWNTTVMQRSPKTAGSMAKALTTAGAVELYDILFDVDQAVIKPESRSTLDEVAKLLKNDASLKLEIGGHTDNTGTPQHNLTLSKTRADAVAAALVKTYGIAASRLRTAGYGDTRPLAPNDTEQNRANNRRVELRKQ